MIDDEIVRVKATKNPLCSDECVALFDLLYVAMVWEIEPEYHIYSRFIRIPLLPYKLLCKYQLFVLVQIKGKQSTACGDFPFQQPPTQPLEALVERIETRAIPTCTNVPQTLGARTKHESGALTMDKERFCEAFLQV